jgi:hypothetical protein
MRAKVIILAFVAAVAVLAPALYFHFKADAPAAAAPDAPVAADNAASAPTATGPRLLQRIQQHQQEGLPSRPAAPEGNGVDHETYVMERRAELTQLSMTDDPGNLKIILSEMENPDARIRQAALTATIDFGSKDAIPSLENEMNWATDPQEKVDIKKAIDFLQLPHLGDDTASNN